jgi:hypothetical protein
MGRFGSALTDQEKEKIDRAAWHEQVQFLKRQQWAVTTAGVVLFGAFLAIMRNHDMSPWEKHLAVLLIVVGVGCGCSTSTTFTMALLLFDARWTPVTARLQFVAAKFWVYTRPFWW